MRQYHEQGSQHTQGESWPGRRATSTPCWPTASPGVPTAITRKHRQQAQPAAKRSAEAGYPRYRSERELITFTEDRIGTELDVPGSATGHLAHQLSYGIELERTTHERPVEKLSLRPGILNPANRPSRARTDRAGVWLGDVASLGQWQFTPTLQAWITSVAHALLDGSNDSNHSWHLLPEPGHQLPLQRPVAQLAQLCQRVPRLPTTRCTATSPTTCPCRPEIIANTGS